VEVVLTAHFTVTLVDGTLKTPTSLPTHLHNTTQLNKLSSDLTAMQAQFKQSKPRLLDLTLSSFSPSRVNKQTQKQTECGFISALQLQMPSNSIR
jgi:hypothetical protein